MLWTSQRWSWGPHTRELLGKNMKPYGSNLFISFPLSPVRLPCKWNLLAVILIFWYLHPGFGLTQLTPSRMVSASFHGIALNWKNIGNGWIFAFVIFPDTLSRTGRRWFFMPAPQIAWKFGSCWELNHWWAKLSPTAWKTRILTAA